jgi:periplasmic copper chaperone A
MMHAKTFLALILFLAWAGNVTDSVAHEKEPGYRAGQIHAIQAWARINPIKGRPAAVFFVLHNESQVADTLTAVSTPIARRALVHQSKVSGGLVKMVGLAKVPVAAGDMVLFEPGGAHVMLFDLLSVPQPGARFPLTLSFAKGKPQTIEVEAKALVNKAPANTKPKAAMEHMHH